MELIYYPSLFLLFLLVIFGPVIFIVLVARPGLSSKITKKELTRKSIVKWGLICGPLALIVLVTTMMAAEPASVRAERQAKDKVAAEQKQAAEKKRLEELKPTKREVSSKSIIPYEVNESEDGTLTKGQKKTITEGVDGERTKTYEVTYVQGVEQDRKLLKDEITKTVVNKKVVVGTYIKPVASAATKPSSSTQPSPEPYYQNCTAAKSAGAAPIYSGQPGYRVALDRDNDGIACE